MNPLELNQQLNATYRRRKAWDWVVRHLLLGAAIIALIPLFSVLGYVLLKGVPGLNISFFTEIPKPVGEAGGGMANALAGTLLLVALASFLGILWGIATGIFLSEYGEGKTGSIVRFSADMLASVPSIVIGLFVYAIIVHPMRRFSALAGGVALGLIMIPTVARTTEEMLRLVPTHIREAGSGARIAPLESHPPHRLAWLHERNYHRDYARGSEGRRRNGAAPVHGLGQPLLEP